MGVPHHLPSFWPLEWLLDRASKRAAGEMAISPSFSANYAILQLCRVAANHVAQFSNGSCRFVPATSAMKISAIISVITRLLRLAVHAEAPRVSGSGLVPAQDQWASAQVHNSMDPLQFRRPAPLVYLSMWEKGREIIRHGLDRSMSALPRYNIRVPAARGKRSQIPPGLPN